MQRAYFHRRREDRAPHRQLPFLFKIYEDAPHAIADALEFSGQGG
jgi:hypothetical protein